LAESKKVQVHELALKDIQALTSGISSDFLSKLTFEATVEKRKFAGGTSLAEVEKQITLLK
jgi:argininosuccinate lyase